MLRRKGVDIVAAPLGQREKRSLAWFIEPPSQGKPSPVNTAFPDLVPSRFIALQFPLALCRMTGMVEAVVQFHRRGIKLGKAAVVLSH